MIAEKIENTVLGEIAKEKQRLDTEIEIARDIQTNLLPKDDARPSPGYDLAYFNRPSREVGGDYFDVVSVGGCLRDSDRRRLRQGHRGRDADVQRAGALEVQGGLSRGAGRGAARR